MSTADVTTHEYQTRVQPHLMMTLKLTNSQSARGSDRGEFFFPCKIMGEVVFNVVEVANDGILSTEKKTEEVLDDLIVSVVGRDLGPGHFYSQPSTTIGRGPENVGRVFFSASSANLLSPDSSNEKSPTVISGTCSFPFSIDVPNKYNPNAVEEHHKHTGLLSKLKGTIGHHGLEGKDDGLAKDETEEARYQLLPPSALRRKETTMGDTGDVEAVYSIVVSGTMHSLMEPHIKFAETIDLLPLDDKILKAPAEPPVYEANEKKTDDLAHSKPARNTVDMPESVHDMKRTQA